MKKKKNVFSKLLNKINAFSNKYLGPDIIEPANELTPIEERELRGIESVGEEVHKNGFTVGQVIISEAKARKVAAAKANNRKNPQIQRN